MKVSVYIVCYNQEDLIEECVLSCVDQDYKDLEVIVSDDCSTDGTQEVLRCLQKRFPERLKVIFNDKNVGITGNCNRALAECKGDFIAQCAGDDYFYPSKISTQIKYFIADAQLTLCYHTCHILDYSKVVGVSGGGRKNHVKDWEGMIKKTGAHIPPSSVMVRASSLPDGGFNTDIIQASDWLFYIEVAMKGSIRRIDKILSVYRYHSGNIGKKYLSYMDDFIKTESILCSKYSDNKIKYAARKGIRRMMLGNIYRAKMNGDALLLNRSLEELRLRSSFPLFYFVKFIVSFKITGVLFMKCKSLIKTYL